MRIAVFSDIHGNYQVLDSIIKHISKNNIDKVIYLGDGISLGPDSSLCLSKLNSFVDVYVLGNHEHYIIDGCDIDSDMSIGEINHNNYLIKRLDKQDINKLKEYNNSYELVINNKKFLFIHFFLDSSIYPYKHLDIFKSDEYKQIINSYNYDYIFYGHYHSGRYDFFDNKACYCIGSSGCVKNNKTFYYIIDSNDDISIERVVLKYDRLSFENRINNIKYPEVNKIKKSFFGIK